MNFFLYKKWLFTNLNYNKKNNLIKIFKNNNNKNFIPIKYPPLIFWRKKRHIKTYGMKKEIINWYKHIYINNKKKYVYDLLLYYKYIKKYYIFNKTLIKKKIFYKKYNILKKKFYKKFNLAINKKLWTKNFLSKLKFSYFFWHWNFQIYFWLLLKKKKQFKYK
jgi:hypothetical protein